MSTTTMSASNSSTIAKWEKKTWVEAIQQTNFGLLAGSGAIYDASNDFRGTNNRGDNITFNYVNKLVNNPRGEGQTSYANEEALQTNTHNMAINVTRVPVANPNNDTIEQQRTDIQFDEVSANVMYERAMELWDTSIFNQLAGFDPTSFSIDGTTYSTTAQKLQVQGHNVPVAPTSNRIIRAGSQSNDQSITSSNKMTLDLIDYSLEKIAINRQPMKPCSDGYYKLFVSPEQAVDLMHDSSGKIQKYINDLAKVEGGKADNVGFKYTDGTIYLGDYQNVKIYQAPRVSYGVNDSSSAVITAVRRAVMVGKDALSFASPFGGMAKTDKATPFKMYTELSDYDYIKGMDLRCVYGLKKMSPANNQDIGSFVISTYAAPHA